MPNFVDPFFGSGAVLLARPEAHLTDDPIETANDLDGMVSNFWRALQADPDGVAHYADWPVHECDLHARHIWLVNRKPELQVRLEGNPDWFDAKAAGWWLWGICAWIGSGWCSGEGPWNTDGDKLVHLGNAGRGVKRQRPHLSAWQGVKRQIPHLGDAGQGGLCEQWSEHLRAMMGELADRLRRVRVCCGDWTRVLGPTPTTKLGLTAVFLDPPYSHAERDDGIYAEDHDVSADVRQWAIQHSDDPLLRIALCGYDTEHQMPDTWECFTWKAQGGYGNKGDGRGRANAERETIWFSPHCLRPDRARQERLL